MSWQDQKVCMLFSKRYRICRQLSQPLSSQPLTNLKFINVIHLHIHGKLLLSTLYDIHSKVLSKASSEAFKNTLHLVNLQTKSSNQLFSVDFCQSASHWPDWPSILSLNYSNAHYKLGRALWKMPFWLNKVTPKSYYHISNY